jgi:hypothetical protein
VQRNEHSQTESTLNIEIIVHYMYRSGPTYPTQVNVTFFVKTKCVRKDVLFNVTFVTDYVGKMQYLKC